MNWEDRKMYMSELTYMFVADAIKILEVLQKNGLAVAVTGIRRIYDYWPSDRSKGWYNPGKPSPKWERTLEVVAQWMLASEIGVVKIGMAIGFDMLVAMVCHINKIPFVAYVPFLGQEDRWIDETKDVYNMLLRSESCKGVVLCYTPEQVEALVEKRMADYHAKTGRQSNEDVTRRIVAGILLNARNKLMLEEPCEHLLAGWDGRTEKSGTYNTITLAGKMYGWKPKDSHMTIINPARM